MAVDLIEGYDHEALGLGNVNGVGGYTAGGAGNDTLDVVAGRQLVGVNSLTWTLVAGNDGQCSFYSQTIASTRASGARWRFSFHAKALAALGASAVGWLSLTDAAFVEFVSPSTGLTTDGLRIGIYGDGVTAMSVQVNDNESSSITSPRNVTPAAGLLLNRDTLFVVDVNADDTYELWCDQGSGRVSLTTGTLISGNTLIQRYVVWNAASTIVSNAIYYDEFYIVTPRADTPATVRDHLPAYGKITAATLSADKATVAVTTTIYDAQTTLALATFDETIPASWISGEPKDDTRGKLDGIVARALQAYQNTRNASAIIGHELEF